MRTQKPTAAATKPQAKSPTITTEGELATRMSTIIEPNKRRRRRLSPFARFEAALAGERKAAKTAESSDPEAPVDRPRRRTGGASFVTKESVRMEVEIPPAITAKAALEGMRSNRTTNAVLQQWIEDDVMGRTRTPDLGVEILLRLTIGTNALNAELAQELERKAREQGIDPAYLVVLCIRDGLKLERK